MPYNSTAMITLTNCGIKRGSRWLVRGVDLSISPGEIVTLIGPNGSGKSTTAKMALGILKPDEGKAQSLENLVVGYVPQKIELDWTLPLTVERFMHLTGRISNEDLENAFEQTGIAHLRTNQVHNLSGGEFQRTLLARAIARKPDLLVLDEPVQGVDFAGEIALYELIAEIREKLGCGILMISHDLHVVMASTDQVICLNGHVCCSGSPKTVASSEAYQALFGARSNSALAFYEHNHDHTHLPDGRVQHADGSITDHCPPDDRHHKHKQDKQ